MFRGARVRTLGVALVVYGLLGFVVGVLMALVGGSTLAQVNALRTTLDQERGSLATSLRAVSRTLGDASSGAGDFQRSLDGARDSADTAARLATDSATTFRSVAQAMQLQVFGIQPFGQVAPQFEASAAQMDQLSTNLAATRESIRQNGSDVVRVSGDLRQVQGEVNRLATVLDDSAGLGTSSSRITLPYEVAFYGMCLFFALQSLFSLIAGVALLREHESLLALAELVRHHRARGNIDSVEASAARSERPPASRA